MKAIIQEDLSDAFNRFKDIFDGKQAGYIPELLKSCPSHFGLSAATVAGDLFSCGDQDVFFTLQSLSKPFVYGLAIEDHGRQELVDKVGVFNTGLAFNSVIDSAIRATPLQNPLGNAGALATTSLIKGSSRASKFKRVQRCLEAFIGRAPAVDLATYRSEIENNQRNRALAYLYDSYGLFYGDVEDALDRYTKTCALRITCQDLARMGATLANRGKNPWSGIQVFSPETTCDILSVMLIYGLYEQSGNWIFEVGLPGKSGVSGGVLAVRPGVLAIAAYSPLIDHDGNSIRSVKAITHLSKKWRLHLLA